MRVVNWVKNLLDTNPRREAVRTLASVRSRIVEGRKDFCQVRETVARLHDRVALLEREGATPQDVVECISTVTLLGRLATDHLSQLNTISLEFKSNYRKTPENDEFVIRVRACAEKLQRRVDIWMAEENLWATREPHNSDELISRIHNLKTQQQMKR